MRNLEFEKIADRDPAFVENRPIALAMDYVGAIIERPDTLWVISDPNALSQSLEGLSQSINRAEDALIDQWGTLRKAESTMRNGLRRGTKILANGFGDERKLRILHQMLGQADSGDV